MNKETLNKRWWFVCIVCVSVLASQHWLIQTLGLSEEGIPISEITFNSSFFAQVFVGFSVFLTLFKGYSFLWEWFFRRLLNNKKARDVQP